METVHRWEVELDGCGSKLVETTGCEVETCWVRSRNVVVVEEVWSLVEIDSVLATSCDMVCYAR